LPFGGFLQRCTNVHHECGLSDRLRMRLVLLRRPALPADVRWPLFDRAGHRQAQQQAVARGINNREFDHLARILREL